MSKRRKQCKHENADHLMAGEWFTMHTETGGQPMHVVDCEQFRCIDCGAWLSLGPSNDDDPRVITEIGAARLVAGDMDIVHAVALLGARAAMGGDEDPPPDEDALNWPWHAGFLAACIIHHDRIAMHDADQAKAGE